jgi:hypothetical protein
MKGLLVGSNIIYEGGGDYSLKGLPPIRSTSFSYYGVRTFYKGLLVGVKKDFAKKNLYIWDSLFFKGASLFRVRPSLLWSTYFLKGAYSLKGLPYFEYTPPL